MVDIQEGTRLCIVPVFALEEVPTDKRITFLAQNDGGGEVRADVYLVREGETIPVFLDGHTVGGGGRQTVGENQKTRLMIAQVVIFHRSLTQHARVVVGVRPAAKTAFQPVIRVK